MSAPRAWYPSWSAAPELLEGDSPLATLAGMDGRVEYAAVEGDDHMATITTAGHTDEQIFASLTIDSMTWEFRVSRNGYTPPFNIDCRAGSDGAWEDAHEGHGYSETEAIGKMIRGKVSDPRYTWFGPALAMVEKARTVGAHVAQAQEIERARVNALAVAAAERKVSIETAYRRSPPRLVRVTRDYGQGRGFTLDGYEHACGLMITRTVGSREWSLSHSRTGKRVMGAASLTEARMLLYRLHGFDWLRDERTITLDAVLAAAVRSLRADTYADLNDDPSPAAR